MRLSPAFSAYLDAVRVLAALVVVIGHASAAGFGPWGNWAGQFGHTMVLVFFVLSGYIVTRTTLDGRIDRPTYVLLRTTRVYVVAIPAITLSLVISQILSAYFPHAALVDDTWAPLTAWNVLSSLLFLNQSWNNTASLSLNAPYWSLCYEAWFYAIFCCFYYGSGMRRYVLTAAALFISGPAIVTLLPVWLMGAALALPRFHNVSPVRWPALAIVAPLAVMVVSVALEFDLWVKAQIESLVPAWWWLRVSTKVATDIPLAAFFSLHLLAVHARMQHANRSTNHRHWAWARYAAGASFSVYVFHDPILRLLAAVAERHRGGIVPFCLAITLVVFLAWCLSRLTEAHTAAVRTIVKRWLLPRSRAV
jgi:peptidoglycan/LPS O-acetylase OafA/YrhL